MKEITICFGASANLNGNCIQVWMEISAFRAFFTSPLELYLIYIPEAQVWMIEFTLGALSTMLASAVYIKMAVRASFICFEFELVFSEFWAALFWPTAECWLFVTDFWLLVPLGVILTLPPLAAVSMVNRANVKLRLFVSVEEEGERERERGGEGEELDPWLSCSIRDSSFEMISCIFISSSSHSSSLWSFVLTRVLQWKVLWELTNLTSAYSGRQEHRRCRNSDTHHIPMLKSLVRFDIWSTLSQKMQFLLLPVFSEVQFN